MVAVTHSPAQEELVNGPEALENLVSMTCKQFSLMHISGRINTPASSAASLQVQTFLSRPRCVSWRDGRPQRGGHAVFRGFAVSRSIFA